MFKAICSPLLETRISKVFILMESRLACFCFDAKYFWCNADPLMGLTKKLNRGFFFDGKTFLPDQGFFKER